MNVTRLIYIVGMLAPALSGWGAGVWIDSSQVTLSRTGATVINARLRASAGGVDQLMADGGRTNATSGPTLGHNLGTVAAISSRDYAFTLEHRVGQGMIFRLVDSQSTPETWLLAFGSGFSPALPVGPTTRVATQATLGGMTPAGLPNFNSLRLEVRASVAHAPPPEESASVSGLYFSSPTLTLQDGALDPMATTPTTAGQTSGEVVNRVPIRAAAGFGYQRLVSDEPLNFHDWTLGGVVHLQRSGTGNGETVRMVIYGQQVTATFPPLTPAPEPTSAMLLLLGGALALRRRRGEVESWRSEGCGGPT
ncbi:MAG: PEP-CTERM sorting domain-containing protein [Verrucomicrobiales bacterium]